jgi:hypothetical protein
MPDMSNINDGKNYFVQNSLVNLRNVILLHAYHLSVIDCLSGFNNIRSIQFSLINHSNK